MRSGVEARCAPERAMKAAQRILAAVLLALSLAALAGCAATPSRESTGEYIDDAVITAKVKAAFVDQPTLKATEIKVDTYQGTVYLSGVLADQASIDEAIRVARTVPGVKAVKSELRRM